MPIYGNPRGGAQLEVVYTIDPETAVADGAVAAPSANAAYLHRFRVGRAITISGVTFYVGTSSGNVDVGIYTYDGTSFTKVVTSGSTAVSGTNALQTVALSTALLPGVDYATAIALDNATVTILRINSTNTAVTGFRNMAVAKTTAFPLPASIASPSASSTIPFLALA